MNTAALSLDQSPPLSVPAPFFATAPWFAVAAGAWLVLDPSLLQGRWLPGTLALTHLLTLGFLTMVMAGAFQQLLPVLAGAPVPRPRIVSLTVYSSLTVGTVALGWGLARGAAVPVQVGVVALGLALILFIGAAAWSLSASRSSHATIKAMGAALAALTITAGLGLHLGAAHGFGTALARHLTDVHAAWGLVGWLGLLVMGVAYQVVPMFQITPDYPRPLMRALVPVSFAGLVAWSAAVVAAPALATWLVVIPAAGLAVFAIATLWIQHRRRRRLPDVTLDFWRLAMGALLLALTVWGVSALMGRPQPEVLLGLLFIVGFGVSVISGMSYKIVPFLIWLHLNNRIFTLPALRGRVPNMKQVIPERRTRWHLRLHALALLLLTLAAATGDTDLTRGAGAVFAIASAFHAWNVSAALWLYRRLLREAAAPASLVGCTHWR